MIKKVIFGAGVAVVLPLLFFGRDAWSYVATSAGWVKSSVRDSVPVEFEIQRARDMVKNLVPDIQRNMHLIAKEEVEVERLGKQISETENRLAKDKTDMMRLKTDVETGGASFQYGERKYTVTQVKADLSNRFARYKTNDATLNSLRDMQAARQRSLEGAQQKLENMLAIKRQLEVEVEHLDARLKMVEAAQTTSNYKFDDSQLSRAKELVSDLRARLDVAEKLVNAEGAFQGEIVLDEPATGNIVNDVTDYFKDGDKPSAEKTTAKTAEKPVSGATQVAAAKAPAPTH